MIKWFATYFGFSRRELNGVCVLAVVLLLLWATLHVFSFRSDATEGDLSAQIAEIDSFLATTKEPQSSSNYHADSAADKWNGHATEVTYFAFDPNGLSVVDWKRLGLSESQVRMIKNYEAKGGRFRKKEDLAKIYAISDADYARLEPYINIKQVESRPVAVNRVDSGQQTVSPGRQTRASQALYIDLNGADSLELQYLPGIGPVFASRIVRFRDLLGGFHHTSQLMDVYGFDSVRFEGLKAHIYVDTSKIDKIAINTAEYQHFSAHPFIDHKLANAIVQYRKQHGPYKTINDLLHIAIMEEHIFLKIAPYLSLAND